MRWRAEVGQSANSHSQAGGKQFYRFQKPGAGGFPFMLELFSRVPDGLDFEPDGRQLVPIPVEEAVSSLSAILLEDDYYRLIRNGTRQLNGLACVKETVLIPLKARAWLDLRKRKEAGDDVDSKNMHILTRSDTLSHSKPATLSHRKPATLSHRKPTTLSHRKPTTQTNQVD